MANNTTKKLMRNKQDHIVDSNKKVTAVEFLEKKYYDNDYNIFQEDFEQAKEMEKQQTITAMINTDTSKQNITEIVAKGMKYWKQTYEQ